MIHSNNFFKSLRIMKLKTYRFKINFRIKFKNRKNKKIMRKIKSIKINDLIKQYIYRIIVNYF